MSRERGKRKTKRGGMASAMGKESKKVAKRRSQSGMPWRFRQRYGEECEIIFLDHELDDGHWQHEHNLKGSDGKFGNIEPCIKESGACPHCEDGSNSGLMAILSVIVVRPYKSKKTGKSSEHSKMVFAFTHGQFKDFERVEKIAKKKYGTLRGTSIILFRDNEETSYRTGSPVPNEDGQLINDHLSEKQLVKEFGHKAVKGRKDGKILKEKNAYIKPYDYAKLFPKPDADKIREDYGMDATAGSRDTDDDDDDSDDIPGLKSRRKRGSKKSKRSSRSRRSRSEEKDDDQPTEKKKKKNRKRKKRRSKSDDTEPDFDD